VDSNHPRRPKSIPVPGMKTIHLVAEMNAPDQGIQDPGAATTETNPGRIVKILRKEEENRKNPLITEMGNQEEESQTGTNKVRIIQENLTTRILPHALNKKVSPKKKVA
jgi:hypothetical protein